MSIAIEPVPAPFLVTVTVRPEATSVLAPHPAPVSAVRPAVVGVSFGWEGFSASELAELTWEDAAWQ